MSALTASLYVALAALQVAVTDCTLILPPRLKFSLHCIILGVVHIKDGLLERGNVLSGNLQSLSGMFCLPNVGVGGAMDMFRDGCVASETVFVEDKLGH